MRRVILGMAVIAISAALATPVLASQYPALIAKIHAEADSRLDDASYAARVAADEAERLHKDGKHEESEKVAKEGLEKLGLSK